MNEVPTTASTAITPSAGSEAPPAAESAAALTPANPPGMISVMCPVGYTSYATQDLAVVRPLYARVTYRPA